MVRWVSKVLGINCGVKITDYPVKLEGCQYFMSFQVEE